MPGPKLDAVELLDVVVKAGAFDDCPGSRGLNRGQIFGALERAIERALEQRAQPFALGVVLDLL